MLTILQWASETTTEQYRRIKRRRLQFETLENKSVMSANPLVPTLDFDDYDVDSYGGHNQDQDGTAAIEDNGATLRLEGNVWKKIDFRYTVTSDTILEFDFRSPQEGEIHAIGLDTNRHPTRKYTVQLHGTQSYGDIRDHFDYGGAEPGWQHYRIQLGDYYRGSFKHMFFINDHDVRRPDAESYFSNIRIHEAGRDDAFTVDEDSGVASLDVMANDRADQSTQIVSVSAGSEGGTTTIVGGKTINYRPAADFYGEETFTYTLSDDPQSPVTVTMEVTPTNDAPVAVDDALTTTINTELVLSDPGVLINDTDADGDALAIAEVTQPSHGTVSWGDDGSLVYTPNAGFSGTDSFTYVADDGTARSNVATVEIEVENRPAAINFQEYDVRSYGIFQDRSKSVSVEDGGSTLHLEGNAWKQIRFPYKIKSDTILEFDFRSSSEGEIHGIGLDRNLWPNRRHTFQLFGTQSGGLGDFRDYDDATDGWKRYVIPIGEYYTGSFKYLYFINDHDVRHPDAESYFSNVRLYETAQDDHFTVVEDSGVNSLDVLANDAPDSGKTLTISSVSDVSPGGTLTIVDGTSIDYQPAADFFGTETFTYTVTDGTPEFSSTATVTVDVTPVNDTPVAIDDVYTTHSNGDLTISATGVLLNDTDVDGDELSIDQYTLPTHGTLSMETDGSFVYTPDAGFSGTDSFTYIATDGIELSDSATVEINVEDGPVPINFEEFKIRSYGGRWYDRSRIALVEDGGATLHLAGNTWKQIKFPYDITPDTILEFDFRSPKQGEIHGIGFDTNLFPTRRFTFQLYGTQSRGWDQFRDYDGSQSGWQHYRIPIGEFYTGSFKHLFFINDHDVRHPDAESYFSNVKVYEATDDTVPEARDDSFAVQEDSGATSLDVLANDSTDSGETLTITAVGTTSHGGTVNIVGGTSIDYQPLANFFGQETFTYTVNDGTPDNDATATVTVTVNNVNDVPVADAQLVSTTEDTPVAITLTASDVDPDTLTYIIVDDPANGTLSGTEPNLTYTPTPNFSGSDSFTFKVNDGTVDSAIVTVSIEVTSSNQGPIAPAHLYGAHQNRVMEVEESQGLLNGASDGDGDTLTVNSFDATSAEGGTITGVNLTTGAFTYTPPAGFLGVDTFDYSITDSQGGIGTSTVTVIVRETPVNTPPVAIPQTVVTFEDTPVEILLTGSDVDRNPLTFDITQGADFGRTRGSDPPMVTYMPRDNFFGSDSFAFNVNDGLVDSPEATVSIEVLPVNDAPIADSQSVSTNENTPLAITLTGFDEENDPLSYQVVDGPENGALSGTEPDLVYTPDAGFQGDDSFTFVINDGTENSAVATVNITVNAVLPAAASAAVATTSSGANQQQPQLTNQPVTTIRVDHNVSGLGLSVDSTTVVNPGSGITAGGSEVSAATTGASQGGTDLSTVTNEVDQASEPEDVTGHAQHQAAEQQVAETPSLSKVELAQNYIANVFRTIRSWFSFFGF